MFYQGHDPNSQDFDSRMDSEDVSIALDEAFGTGEVLRFSPSKSNFEVLWQASQHPSGQCLATLERQRVRE